ncbi:hypothetical protein R1U54_002871 [Vibrio fluvialis]|uniref:GTP pyrophosphokinase n=1 Tax=Vibrio fluvialis TaxID=676 RepID=UPI001EECAF5E|nr:hypothetical protein [Vibrio fluvialis]EKO3407511.1 hypothetical protein [Vibrio fluvialis]ELP2652761.1 hypothetical protein [Vibrio fluvialis]MCG6373232.1 hypothetical protein [Vibrio fluvialis]
MSDIVKNFKDNRTKYLSLEQTSYSLLSNLIADEEVTLHSITSRTKTVSSLQGKVSRPTKNYSSIEDITDLVGVRITTYFSDDIDHIADLISKEFSVDIENSIDKRKSKEPERFGYTSLHLIVTYSPKRIKLQEYSKFKGIKFEIQIRSILQHAWAEIEHDIGYKSEIQVPAHLRRRFSRLSGLLELADEEFLAIRDGLSQYVEELPEYIRTKPEIVGIDLSSLKLFVSEHPVVNTIEFEVANQFHAELIESDEWTLSHNLEFMAIFGHKTLGDILDDYQKYKDLFVPFVKAWLARPSIDDEDRSAKQIRSGISLLYLTYIKLADLDDESMYINVLTSAPFQEVSDLVEEIQEVWREVKI